MQSGIVLRQKIYCTFHSNMIYKNGHKTCLSNEFTLRNNVPSKIAFLSFCYEVC